MAKGGKLTKLKSVLRKWNSFGSMLNRTTNGTSIVAATSRSSSSSSDFDSYKNNSNNNNNIMITRKNLHPVYVGKSRRRYLVSSEVVENPVFRELVERSGDKSNVEEGGESTGVNLVGCEVVMFEHLLWMLENGDPDQLDNFVDFYSCC